MSKLRMIYLGLAVIGTLVPMYHFLPWILENGASISLLLGALKANGATTGLYYDFLISAITLNIWILVETYIRKDYWVLVCLPATYLIGISCGLPLFLFLRSRQAI